MNPLFSYGKKYGYSNFETGLAAYIICALIISICLFIFNQAEVQRAINPHNTAKLSSNGSIAKTPTVDPAPSRYTLQNYQAHDFKIRMKFDPNSYAIINFNPDQTGPNGTKIIGNDEVEINGNQLNSLSPLGISINKIESSSVGLLSPSANPDMDLVEYFNSTIMGKPYVVYIQNNGRISIFVNVLVNQAWYSVTMTNDTQNGAKANTPISQTTAQTILESLQISR